MNYGLVCFHTAWRVVDAHVKVIEPSLLICPTESLNYRRVSSVPFLIHRLFLNPEKARMPHRARAISESPRFFSVKIFI